MEAKVDSFIFQLLEIVCCVMDYNLLEVVSDSIKMLYSFVYIKPFDFHGKFEEGLVKNQSVGNRVVVLEKVTTSS